MVQQKSQWPIVQRLQVSSTGLGKSFATFSGAKAAMEGAKSVNVDMLPVWDCIIWGELDGGWKLSELQ